MAKSEGSNKRGRPTRYNKSLIHTAYRLCRNHGYTDAQLADVLGVGSTTLYNWKNKHGEFREALRRGKDEYDSEHVESALLKRAKGFVRKRVTKRTYKRGGHEYTDTQESMEEVAGSVRAQETWLFNRNPERWRRVPKETVDAQEEGKSGVLIAPAQEDFESWLHSLGIDPKSTLDGNPTSGDSSTS